VALTSGNVPQDDNTCFPKASLSAQLASYLLAQQHMCFYIVQNSVVILNLGHSGWLVVTDNTYVQYSNFPTGRFVVYK
jgi:hypothetical protein